MTIERKAFLIGVVLLVASMGVTAAPPDGLRTTWARGPVQWLMTGEEQRAWRAVSNDQQAADFIDLFWARRDPTPGTPNNEFRNEFDARVTFADKAFTGEPVRGSLTDRGRVYIVLGPPNGMPGINGVGENPSFRREGPGFTGVFTYYPPQRWGLTGLVIFTENTMTREYKVDFQKSNIAGALADAVRHAIVNPDLHSVPAWARAQTPSEQQNFQIAMVVASTNGGESAPAGSPSVVKAINDLRALLPFKRYDLVDSAQVTCRSGKVTNVEMKGPGGKAYRILFLYTNASSGGKELTVSMFNVMRSPAGRPSATETAAPEAPESVFATSFAMSRGETLSVGSSRPSPSTDALLFFVTAVVE